MNFLINGAFFFYLEERVQPFDLDHPPVAREVGPVAGGVVAAGGGRLPWRWSGGHRGKERAEEEREKGKEEKKESRVLKCFDEKDRASGVVSVSLSLLSL